MDEGLPSKSVNYKFAAWQFKESGYHQQGSRTENVIIVQEKYDDQLYTLSCQK